MALFAPGTLRQLETRTDSLGVSMHLSSGMAVHASHLLLFIMHVCRVVPISSSQLCIHPTTMTAGAGGIHRRLFLKDMSRKKATIYIIRTADMALTATGMTGSAMFVFGLQNFVQALLVFLIGPGLDNLGEWSQSVVEAILGCGGNLLVAFSAGLVCCRKGRILDDFLVSSLPVRISRITTMAGLA